MRGTDQGKHGLGGRLPLSSPHATRAEHIAIWDDSWKDAVGQGGTARAGA